MFGNEGVRIDRRPRRHRQDVAVVWIDHDERAALHAFLQHLLAKPLQLDIERRDDVVARLRRDGNLLARFPARRVKGDVVLSFLALELVVESLFKPLATLRARPEHFVILNRSVRRAAGAARVSDDVPGERTIRIKALIGWLEGEAFGLSPIEFLDLIRLQILRDDQRQDAAVFVMLENEFLAERDRPASDGATGKNLLFGIEKSLALAEGQRRWEDDREIVAHARLRERLPVAIHDLPARRRDIQHVGARMLLRVPRRREAGRAGAGFGGFRGSVRQRAVCRDGHRVACRLQAGSRLLRPERGQGKQANGKQRTFHGHRERRRVPPTPQPFSAP
jgi:hypothetical protein